MTVDYHIIIRHSSVLSLSIAVLFFTDLKQGSQKLLKGLTEDYVHFFFHQPVSMCATVNLLHIILLNFVIFF